MTLPGVALLLLFSALALHLTSRLRTSERRTRSASAGFDVLSELLHPADRHRLDEVHREELDRDDVGDGAPPRSRVDLDAGTAHIRVPRACAIAVGPAPAGPNR